MVHPEDVLRFWFEDAAESPANARERMPFWFEGTPHGDAASRERFGAALEAAARGALASWMAAPRSSLARVVLLDQFPRNIWRGTARAYAQDAQALAAAKHAVTAGFVCELAPIEQVFLVLPYEHSEALDAQRESVRLNREIAERAPPDWRGLLESQVLPYAEQHLSIIERFGRFPHRNAVLDRVPTPEEVSYLETGGETFGQGER
jgi:uncharacterized protein (DUF924 family)